MSRSKPAPIAIVGAGPCGLTLARLLERAGIDYIVFERDASATENRAGGTLDLHPGTGQAALEAAGLRDEFEALARHEAAVFTVQDAAGEIYFRDQGGDEVGGESDRPEIDRLQLRHLLLDSIPAERIRWGKKLSGVERVDADGGDVGGAGWVLRFADGSSESGFRLVVGADGAWSKVRPLITSAKPRYSGKTYFEGRISPGNPQYAAAQDMVGPGNSAAIGAGRVLVVQQMSDRSYRVYAGVEAEKSTDTDTIPPTQQPGGILDFATDVEASRAALLALFEDGWAPRLRAFIEHAEGPWRVWQLYTFDAAALGRGAGPRIPGVTLLGDAAHVTLPNGEGVNIAMLDALKLCECLVAEVGGVAVQEKEEGGPPSDDARADAAAVERAVDAYETGMWERAREHVSDGISMNELMFSADGAGRMIDMFKQFAEQAGQA